MRDPLATADVVQEIRTDTLYGARDLRRRFSIGELSWRQMKQRGLRVHRLGKTPVVLGADLIAFLVAQSAEDRP